MDVEGILREHISNEFMHSRDASVLKRDTGLIEDGIIDSMGLIRLVAFIESRFGVTVSENELDLDNFRTLGALTDFLEKKLGGAGTR